MDTVEKLLVVVLVAFLLGALTVYAVTYLINEPLYKCKCRNYNWTTGVYDEVVYDPINQNYTEFVRK